MSLTNIVHLAGAWAELVAFSPALTIFDSGDVEILNEDIPEYDGPAGIVGTVLALLMCALGAVKKIYQVNEDEIRRRRSITVSDLYFQMAQLLDIQQCASLFMCSIAFEAQSTKVLSPEKMFIIRTLSQDGLHSNSLKKVNNSFVNATHLGLGVKSRRECESTYSKCPYNRQTLEGAFKLSQRLSQRNLMWLKDLANKIRFSRIK